MFKALLVFIIAAAVLCPSASAFTLEPEYMARLPRSMPVYCTWSQAEWSNDPYGGAFVQAYTFIAGPHDGDIHLSPQACVGLQDPSKYEFSQAAETLYHEWFHSFLNTRDEGETECLALFIYNYALVNFWGFTPQAAAIDHHRAWLNHLELGLEYPLYRGECKEGDVYD